MYCCSQLCITSRENIVCVILVKKIIILLIRTYCLIENVTFTCYSLCSWWCRFSFLCSVRNHFCTNDRFKVYIFEDTWQGWFRINLTNSLYCAWFPLPLKSFKSYLRLFPCSVLLVFILLLEHEELSLAFQLTISPTFIHSFQLIILSFVGVRNLNKHSVLRPIQLWTQCVPIWIGLMYSTEVHTAYRMDTSIINDLLYLTYKTFGLQCGPNL